MGARGSEVWCRPSDAAAAGALALLWCPPRERADMPERAPPRAGQWCRVWQEDFDAERLSSRSLCPGEVVACGETIYLAMYDGPAGELCGTWLYEHRLEGKVARALTYSPGDDDDQLRWTRVEGLPETWEGPLLSVKLDDMLGSWRDSRRWEDPPLPDPTPAEVAEVRASCLSIGQGSMHPRVSEYVLCGAIYDAFGLREQPGR